MPDTPKKPTKADLRRDDLRARLVDVAEGVIAQNGLAAVKARDLAKSADCAVGAIYNVFPDLNGLIMAVNGRTFHALGGFVSASVAASAPDKPQAELITMSLAYLRFANDNTNLWRALFDLEMSTDMDVPQWYLAELGKLFALIGAPLARLFPEMPRQDVEMMTRTLFSSVHGIVHLGLQRRISGVPIARMEEMIAILLSNVTSHANFSEHRSK
ncbi:transcriptional regulator, TetR family [Pseudorhodobacter antarcticus]|jgi:AcrR family transcriptional regulator|uniref:Transcriptional regulator, TetR family n=1 Tax=Pseudorhodobacter antarcticus TaxID=1077947 RepID=A0A1H8CP40_9RHOB|nr:TetR/AcrR family transcriptional regulator [Pseudorhodobacter antarcticus]SEM95877.1 transcriptional regulator, TetR family [Pseudorhodobacter antarcticus]